MSQELKSGDDSNEVMAEVAAEHKQDMLFEVAGEEKNDETPHEHGHAHTKTKQVLRRINTIAGHMQGIGNMVAEGRDCSDVLIQLAAVEASLKKVKTIILKDHVEHCIVHAIENNDHATIDKLRRALDQAFA